MKLRVIQQRTIWWSLSSVIILAGIVAMVISWTQFHAPVRPSLDFVGGTRLQLELDCTQPGNCDKPVDLEQVRNLLKDQGLSSGSSVQAIEGKTDQGVKRPGLTIRTASLSVDQRSKLQSALTEKVGAFDPATTKIDTVGPTLGRQLFSSGLLALLVSFAGINLYLAFRFKLDYAIFAIVALFHDVLITMGIFSFLGLVAGVEADSLFIVALLTIVGFSVHDTVVIYDRVRETIELNPGTHINEIVESAVNQTLGRSINTTLTVLLTLVALFLFGGETLKNFALALIIGFTMGAYSSIFIASTMLALWREKSGQSIVGEPAVSALETP
jgi:preprotein translocase subunit SecF